MNTASQARIEAAFEQGFQDARRIHMMKLPALYLEFYSQETDEAGDAYRAAFDIEYRLIRERTPAASLQKHHDT